LGLHRRVGVVGCGVGGWSWEGEGVGGGGGGVGGGGGGGGGGMTSSRRYNRLPALLYVVYQTMCINP